MRFIDHPVTSPVTMYRRWSLDSWFAFCWLWESVGILPCSIVDNDVRSMCIAQLRVSVWGGVYGRVIVGIPCCREGIVLWLCVAVVYHSLSLLWMLVGGGKVGRFSPS